MATIASTTDAVPQSRPRIVLGMLWRDKFATAAAIFLAIAVLCAIFGPALLGEAATKQNLRGRNAAPFSLEAGWLMFLGADALGRPLLARIIVAAQNTLMIAGGAVALSVTIGAALGLVAGYGPRWAGTAIMRLADVIMSFPSLLLAVIVLYMLSPSVGNVILVLAITRVPIYLRTTRAEVLEIRERMFVQAAQVMGGSSLRIVFRHILPMLIPTLVTIATLDFAFVMLAEVKPEPDLPNLEAAVAATKAAGADAVIGFGGGSAMDLAKLVAVLATSDLALSDISGPNRAPVRQVALAQIPTTAGTGSEVGTRALITDPATMNKVATESVEMLADIAIIDPELTVSVPPMVTAATGIDAMAHCVEAFTSKRSHPIIDAYALQGIELVGRYLGRAVRDGGDVEARAGLALAAFYGGVCLGPVNTTAGHAIAYPLGTRHKLAHGIANALIFPHVLAVNAPAVPEKTALVGRALGFGAEGRQQVLGGARDFCAGLGLDMALKGYGVPHDDLPASAREAHAIRRLLDWNPVDLSEADILEIYEAAY